MAVIGLVFAVMVIGFAWEVAIITISIVTKKNCLQN